MKLTFTDWLKKIDLYLCGKFGLHHDDLPDWDYYTAWQNGWSFTRAANAAVRAAKEF